MQQITHWTLIFASLFLMNTVRAQDESAMLENNTPFGLIPTVVKGNTAFALDLYAQLTDKSGNLFFSPYSLSTALAMTYVGANGETSRQMSQVLHFPKKAELHPAFYHLQNQVNEANNKSDIELHIANALWAQDGYSFQNDFEESLTNYYSAALEKVDFKKDAEKARQRINQWVLKKTSQQIKDLVKASLLNDLTRLVLVNAIYFKGNWASQFNSRHTEDAPFWVTPNQSVYVPMMTQKDSFNYMANGKLQVLELPYAGPVGHSYYNNDSLSMIVLLPRQRDGLAELESSLNTQQLDKWLIRLRSEKVKVKVFLPKFQISSSFELTKTLTKMGMSAAFNEKADFSGIDGTKELSISSVVHQAFVDVNEEGTEAAAATAVIIGIRSLPPPPVTFQADHPFIFLIRHNLSGSILFMGRVVNPTAF
ncbi:MAG: serpin family protein [Pseudomonadota bacterium]